MSYWLLSWWGWSDFWDLISSEHVWFFGCWRIEETIYEQHLIRPTWRCPVIFEVMVRCVSSVRLPVGSPDVWPRNLHLHVAQRSSEVIRNHELYNWRAMQSSAFLCLPCIWYTNIVVHFWCTFEGFRRLNLLMHREMDDVASPRVCRWNSPFRSLVSLEPC